ncbi:hypothetical protein CSUI_009522, partial [Cystoisospora suis]
HVRGQVLPESSASSLAVLEASLASHQQRLRKVRRTLAGLATGPRSALVLAGGRAAVRRDGDTAGVPDVKGVSTVTGIQRAGHPGGPCPLGTFARGTLHSLRKHDSTFILVAPTARSRSALGLAGDTLPEFETPAGRREAENRLPSTHATRSDGGPRGVFDDDNEESGGVTEPSEHAGSAWGLVNELKLVEARIHHLRRMLRDASRYWGSVDAYVDAVWRSREETRVQRRNERSTPPIPASKAEIYRLRYKQLAPPKLKEMELLRSQIEEAEQQRTEVANKLETLAATQPS